MNNDFTNINFNLVLVKVFLKGIIENIISERSVTNKLIHYNYDILE